VDSVIPWTVACPRIGFERWRAYGTGDDLWPRDVPIWRWENKNAWDSGRRRTDGSATTRNTFAHRPDETNAFSPRRLLTVYAARPSLAAPTPSGRRFHASWRGSLPFRSVSRTKHTNSFVTRESVYGDGRTSAVLTPRRGR